MYKITSLFREQESFRKFPHNGIDFKMETGEPIRTIKDGVIRLANYGSEKTGKTVFVEWSDGKTAIYGHLSSYSSIKDGQIVKAGDLIGYAGNTGFSTGSHLHFEIREGGKAIDPSSYINDIQNMNNPEFFTQTVTELKLSFFDFFRQHMELIGNNLIDIKMNFIHFIASTDYSPIIKLLQNVVQFIFFYS